MKESDPIYITHKLLEEFIDSNIELTEADLDNVEQFNDDVTFTVNGNKYACEFTTSLTERGEKILEYKFYLTNNEKSPKRDNFKTDIQYQLALRKAKVGITGTGNQFYVLRNAMGALKRYVQKHKPDYITFTADESNRQKLYKTLFKKYGNQLGEYRITDLNPITGDSTGEEEFWLVRNK
jgi:hypothetical protein